MPTPTPTPTSTSSRSHARSPLSPLSPFPLNSLRRSLLRRRGRRQRERERERREREQQQGETAVISSLLPPLTTTTTTTTTLVSLQCQTFRLRWIDPKHKECAVCAEDFAVNHIISMLPCGHYFCQPCMDQWFFHRPTAGTNSSNSSNQDDDDDDHDANNRLCEVTHTTCPLCRYDCRSDVVPNSSQLYEEHSSTASMVPGAIRLTTDDGPDFSESSESTLDGDHVDIDIDIGALVLSPRAWNMNHFNTDDDNGGVDDHNINNGEQHYRMQRKDDDKNKSNVDCPLVPVSTPSPASTIMPPELASTQDNRNLGQNFDLIVNKILRAKKEQQLLQRRQQKQQHQQKQK